MPKRKEMFIKAILTPKLELNVIGAAPATPDEKEVKYGLSHRFTEIDQNTGRTDLRFVLEEDAGLGFTAEVVVSAIFEVQDYKENEEGMFLMKNTSITILYPYLRNAVSQLCALAGVGTITLPVVDTLGAFGDQTVPAKKGE